MPFNSGPTEIPTIMFGSTEIIEVRLGTVAYYPDTVGALILTGFNVTQTTASGTSNTTLDVSVEGIEGLEYTLSANVGSLSGTLTRIIDETGVDTFQTTLSAQSADTSSRTVIFTVTNNVDTTNTLTDELTQGAGSVTPVTPDPGPDPVDPADPVVDGTASYVTGTTVDTGGAVTETETIIAAYSPATSTVLEGEEFEQTETFTTTTNTAELTQTTPNTCTLDTAPSGGGVAGTCDDPIDGSVDAIGDTYDDIVTTDATEVTTENMMRTRNRIGTMPPPPTLSVSIRGGGSTPFGSTTFTSSVMGTQTGDIAYTWSVTGTNVTGSATSGTDFEITYNADFGGATFTVTLSVVRNEQSASATDFTGFIRP